MAPSKKSTQASFSAAAQEQVARSKRARASTTPIAEEESTRLTESPQVNMPPPQNETEHIPTRSSEPQPSHTLEEQFAEMRTFMLEMGRKMNNLEASRSQRTTTRDVTGYSESH